jgi:hypothetical protein
MANRFTIDKTLTDKRLLAKTLGDPATWTTWIAVLKAAFALSLSDEEKEIFDAVAGGRPLPKRRVRELWVIAGRRGGKSRIAAALAVYYALDRLQKVEQTVTPVGRRW